MPDRPAQPPCGHSRGSRSTSDRRRRVRHQSRSPARHRGQEMTSGTEPGLRFAVLGPVRAWRDDQAIPPGSPQQRALLAALLLRRGRQATASELLNAVWGEDPPPTALAALRSYAFRLRKALGA